MRRKFKGYKDVLMVITIMPVFYVGWFFSAQYGSVYTVSFYPLYVAIIVGFFASFKYRNFRFQEVSTDVLRKEVVLEVLLILSSILIYWILRARIIFPFALTFYLLIAGFSFNVLLKIMYLRKTP